MKAFLINPTARTISEFECSGKPSDIAAILGVTTPHDLIGMAVSPDNPDTPDVIMASRNADHDAGYFLICSLSFPICGTGVLLGVERTTTVGNKDGGKARPAPNMTLETLRSNLVWAQRIHNGPNGEDQFYVDDSHNTVEAIRNVAMGQLANGNCEIRAAANDGGKVDLRHLH